MTTYDREMQDPEFRAEFNRTRIPRKLKKKYKKMGIWSTYVFEGKRCRTMTVEQGMTFRVRLEDSSESLS